MPLNWRIALLAVAVGLCAGGRGAWVWQASDYEKRLADQAADYVQQLADKDRAYGHEREEAAATALQQLAEPKSQRKDLEDRLQEQGKTHWKEMNDAQQIQARLRDRLATADLRLSVIVDARAFAAPGCDGGCEKLPAPEAWYMAPYVPDLTERMLNELSPSPTTATGG